MAQIKLHWVEAINREKIVDIPFIGLNEDEEFDRYHDLINYIKWYYDYDIEPSDYLSKEEFHDLCEYDYSEIINKEELEEIAKKYTHLIKSTKIYPPSCCDNQTGNYCSICGTKLKNN